MAPTMVEAVCRAEVLVTPPGVMPMFVGVSLPVSAVEVGRVDRDVVLAEVSRRYPGYRPITSSYMSVHGVGQYSMVTGLRRGVRA
jgi:hypothetical protein